MRTFFLKQSANSKFLRFGHAPRQNRLSAHPVFELFFPLEHQNLRPSLRHRFGQCGCGNPAPHSNNVVASCRQSRTPSERDCLDFEMWNRRSNERRILVNRSLRVNRSINGVPTRD